MGDPEVDLKYDIEFNAIAEGLAEGGVVPFLGAGFNLTDRPPDVAWEPGKSPFMPSGGELAQHLAGHFKYPLPDRDLARVCQFVVEVRGLAPLYKHLREVFAVSCELTSAHRFLAAIPSRLRGRKYPRPNLLIVTTNYDNLVETAFAAAGEPLEVVSYVADDKPAKGRFAHIQPGGEWRVIARPNEYRDLSLGKSSILLKLHGAIGQGGDGEDSFVISEDHYIDFLTRTDLSTLVPVTLAAQMRSSHFLFLGYSLRDVNLRVILQRICDEQRLSYKSWAVQVSCDALDRRFWPRRNVEVLEAPLSAAIDSLGTRLDALEEFGS